MLRTEWYIKGESSRELGTSFIFWVIYSAVTIIYCTTYEKFVLSTQPSLVADLVWVAKEWGYWLVITPIAFRTLRNIMSKRPLTIRDYLLVGAATLLTALAFRASLHFVLDSADNLGSSIIPHLPRYSTATVAVLLVWHYFFQRPHARSVSRTGSESQPAPAQQTDPRAKILVYKGKDKYLLHVDRIRYASAAGNYAELHTPEETYLIRSTIKNLEKLLPAEQFIRTHRSIIVNLDSIERIKSLPSGSGKVVLKGGVSVPISKRYLTELHSHHPNPAESDTRYSNGTESSSTRTCLKN